MHPLVTQLNEYSEYYVELGYLNYYRYSYNCTVIALYR